MPETKPPPSRMIWLAVGLIVVLSAAGNLWLTYMSTSRDSESYVAALVGWLLGQWWLVAVLCALGGRNWIGGLLLSLALSSVPLSGLLLGAWFGDPENSRNWLAVCLFPWVLPLSAIPLYGIRLIRKWRLVRECVAYAAGLRLADLFSLIATVTFGIMVLRLEWKVGALEEVTSLAESSAIIGVVATSILVLVVPSLWWLSRIQKRPVNAIQFLAAMAMFPLLMAAIAVWEDPRWRDNDFGILASFVLAFAYFFGSLALLWLSGARLETCANKVDVTSASCKVRSHDWERWAAGWLIAVAVVVGVWLGRIELDQRRAAARPKFLEQVNAHHSLNAVWFQRETITDRDLFYIENYDSLRELRLNQNPISDRGLRHLRRLTDLRELGLSETHVTGSGLSELAQIPYLESLDLSYTGVTDDALGRLNPLERFVELSLSGCRIGDPACDFLASFRNLQRLAINDTTITDAGLTKLAALSSLVSLNIGSTTVTDDGLLRLVTLAKLKYLAMGTTQVTGQGFASWPEQQELSYLFAANSNFSDAGLVHISKFTRLNMLDLSQTAVTDRGLAYIARHPSLVQVHLAETKITDEGVKRLGTMPNLSSLYLSGTTVGDAAFQNWDPPPSLFALDLSQTPLTDEGCRHLARIVTLRDLKIGDTAVTDRGIKHFAAASLSHLDIRNTAVTGRGLLDAGFALLRFISFSPGQVSDEEIEELSSTLGTRVNHWLPDTDDSAAD